MSLLKTTSGSFMETDNNLMSHVKCANNYIENQTLLKNSDYVEKDILFTLVVLTCIILNNTDDTRRYINSENKNTDITLHVSIKHFYDYFVEELSALACSVVRWSMCPETSGLLYLFALCKYGLGYRFDRVFNFLIELKEPVIVESFMRINRTNLSNLLFS